jgi:hypothetical protein
MNMRSGICLKTKKQQQKDETPILSYSEYVRTSPNLKNFKAPVLKNIAKQNKLHVTGNKSTLVERITSFFYKVKNTIKIQSAFRRYLVKQMFLLRGPALKNRTLCNNNSDFYTLEPIIDIPNNQFYSYSDNSDFIYGFNVYSIITLWRKKGKVINPYNREAFKAERLGDINRLLRLMKIFFPDAVDENEQCSPIIPQVVPRPMANAPINNVVLQNTDTNNRVNNIINNNIINDMSTYTSEVYRRLIQDIRPQPVPIRIQELFMEIDQLGNYTNPEWFANLENSQYIQFYIYLYGVWYYRGMLSTEIKRKICPLDPFINLFDNRTISNANILNQLGVDIVRRGCLTLAENMVYPGVDTGSRQLGAMHILRALTLVSVPARNNMMWLYESIE